MIGTGVAAMLADTFDEDMRKQNPSVDGVCSTTPVCVPSLPTVTSDQL